MQDLMTLQLLKEKLGEKFFKYIFRKKTFKKLFSILYYMMNLNLLDLNNDILNIIGRHVKKDNLEKMFKAEQILNGEK